MNRIRFILLNSISLILLGAAFVSVLIETVWMIFSQRNYIPIRSLISNFVIGIFIGTAVVILHLLSMGFQKRPMIGYIIGAVSILAILAAVYIQTGLSINNWDLDLKWLIVFLASEGITIPLCVFWHKQISMYNGKLLDKKSSLK